MCVFKCKSFYDMLVDIMQADKLFNEMPNSHELFRPISISLLFFFMGELELFLFIFSWAL